MRILKDTNNPWLKEIPGNWDVKKLKFLCRINTGSKDTQDKLDEGIYPFFVRSPNIESLNEYTHDEEAVLTAGDGVGVGKVFHYYNGKFAAHQRVYIFTEFNGIKAQFIYYYLDANLANEVLMGGAKSTVDSIRRSMLSEFPVCVPNINEQELIVKFLDSRTKEIDKLIKEFQVMKDLLEQQRQSIITETVTKGLNPNVKMKDSGVEWIGEIPEHWEIKRLKNTVDINPSKSEVNTLKDVEVTFLPMENIKAPNDVDYSLVKKLSDVYSGYTYFKNNDLVLAKVTPCFENGNVAIVKNLQNGLGFGTTELHVIRAKQNQNIGFYYYLSQTAPFMQEGISTMYGVGGLKRIPSEFILNYKFAMPSEKEQTQIVQYLNRKCDELSKLQKNIEQQIDKLKQYCQSLIYEAVTGKIDVRDMNLD